MHVCTNCASVLWSYHTHTHTHTHTHQDIKRCYEAMKQQLKSENESQTSSKKNKTNSTDPSTDIESMDNTESESAPHWMEVLIDVLLGLLSQSSLLWRVVVRQMFHGVVHRITPGAISLINNVREREEEKEGERGMGKKGGEGVCVNDLLERLLCLLAGASTTNKRRADGHKPAE